MVTRSDHWHVRPASPADAGALADMANALNVDHGHAPGLYSAATIERLVFGPPPNADFAVAEIGNEAVGYASFQPIFDSDTAEMGLFLIDLYVDPAQRGLGIGRGLMRAAARHARSHGLANLWWGVMEHNRAARRFYESLGAQDIGARFIALAGPALQALSDEDALVRPQSPARLAGTAGG